MIRILAAVGWWMLLLALTTALATSGEAALPTATAEAVKEAAKETAKEVVKEVAQERSAAADRGGVPLSIWNRTLVVMHSPFGGYNAKARVSAARERIALISDDFDLNELTFRHAEVENEQLVMIYAGSAFLFAITRGDLDLAARETLDDVAGRAVTVLREVLIAQQEQRHPILMLKAIGFSAVAGVLLVMVILILMSQARRFRMRIRTAAFASLPRFLGVDLGPVLRGTLTILVLLPFQLVGVLVVFLCASFVLSQFPYTRPWSHVLGEQFLALLSGFSHAIIGAMPDLATIVVILVLTRWLQLGVNAFFRGIEDGVIRVDWLHPESARATRRITALLLWLFAITLAYPYIPGSGSESFKGISVFAGLVLSLGSAGIVNQVMCGLMVVYARTMRAGDLIQAGSVTGRVSELGFLSTKVRTLSQEEVTIPNSVLMGAAITNWSNAGPAGSLISEKISIGYDVPWRQIHALMHLAAARTEGIEDGANAEVLQQELGDFAVLYEIRCRLRWVDQRFETLSRFRSHLLDVFNEQGVQIMSPHFESQPEKPVLVAPGKEYFPPPVPQQAMTEKPPLVP